MVTTPNFALLILCLGVLVLPAESGFQYFQLLVSGDPLSSRFAVVTPDATPFGNDNPYVAFSLDVTYRQASKPDTEIILFHHQNAYTKVLLINDDWCCTPSSFNEGKCKHLGSLNIRGIANWTKVNNHYEIDDTKTIMYWRNLNSFEFDPVAKMLIAKEKVILNKTGIWHFLTAQCNHSSIAEIRGIVEWKNPYGYLSGVLFPFLPMYFCISFSFFFLLVTWIIYVIKYRENLMGLQYVIMTAIIIAFLENSLWAFDFINYNLHGNISDVINIIGALLTSAKLTTIKTTILLVSLGYSITVPTLETRTKFNVILLTLLYFVASAMQEYIWVITTMALQFPFTLQVIVIIAIFVTNLTYIGWIVYSLFRQYKHLSEGKQTEKLSMYKKLIAFLLGFLTLSVVLFFLQVIFVGLNLRDDFWQLWWVWDAFWEFGYFFVLLLVAVLWWPNENNKRYAYSQQLGDNEFDLEDEEDEHVINLKPIDTINKSLGKPSSSDEDNELGPDDGDL